MYKYVCVCECAHVYMSVLVFMVINIIAQGCLSFFTSFASIPLN